MLKKIIIYVLTVSFLIISCGSSKNTSKYHRVKKVTYKSVKSTKKPTVADKIIWTAVSYKGTPYKYGGTTKKGMDCSGLIYTSFKHREVQLPRTSGQMYAKGYRVSLNEVKRGDLLFFKTSRKRVRVNHVGLVTSVKNKEIHFIHSSSSKGVTITSLNMNYWRKAFVKAKRVL